MDTLRSTRAHRDGGAHRLHTLKPDRLRANAASTLAHQLRSTPNDTVLVGGCFDLLHIGHVNLFQRAKSLGGSLVVAVLSDDYVRSYKGPTRPIQPEAERLQMVLAVRAVDRAWISDASTSNPDVIAAVNPRALVFGIEGEPNRDARRRQQAAVLLERFSNLDIYFVPRHGSSRISTSHTVQRLRADCDVDRCSA